MSSNKPYHHSNLREALLRASLDLIHEAGVQGFTLREVARRAEVSHAAPYRHFRDKAQLLAAIAEEGFDRLTEGMRSASSKSPNAFERLRSAGLAYIEFARQHPQHFLVMFAVDLNANLYPSANAAAERAFAELLSLVTACLHARPSETLQAETVALLAWTQVHGIADLSLRNQLGFKTDRELKQFAKLAIEVFGRGAQLA